MIRWVIAAYIVIVLVISAKATAKTSLESNPVVNQFNGQTNSSMTSDVQDPLPSIKAEEIRPVNLDSPLENSVG